MTVARLPAGWTLTAVLTFGAWALPPGAAGGQTLQPAGWDAGLRMAEAVDRNPDPDVVEVYFEARVAKVEIAPGFEVEAWTYNGTIPGPMIRVQVGDRLIVHYTNNLPRPSTIHWHGAADPDRHGRRARLLAGAGPGTLISADSGGSVGMLFGREGNQMLVNGRRRPELVARAGAPQRWRLVNAAKSRYFKLDLGAGHVFRKIGGDGGLIEDFEHHDFIVLGAGERADVIVQPTGAPVGEGLLRSLLHDRGYGSIFGRDFENLVTIRFADQPPYAGGPLPETRRAIRPYDLRGATPVDLELTLSQDSYDQSFAYGINHMPFWEAPPILARRGETQVWTVTNTSAWSHPLHLHGFFFLVLDETGAPVRPLEWKDTVDIRHDRTVRLAVRFDDRPGTWIFHCHILDHADGGLLSAVHLDLPIESFAT